MRPQVRAHLHPGWAGGARAGADVGAQGGCGVQGGVQDADVLPVRVHTGVLADPQPTSTQVNQRINPASSEATVDACARTC